MGKTVRAMSTDRVRAEDLELEPDDIIAIIKKYCECTTPEYKLTYDEKWIRRKECKHPATRQCLTKYDKIVYECIACGILSNTKPKPIPLSQDPWI